MGGSLWPIVLASSGEPKWISLGNASVIETNVSLYQKSVHRGTADKALPTLLKALHQEIWTPIDDYSLKERNRSSSARMGNSTSFPSPRC